MLGLDWIADFIIDHCPLQVQLSHLGLHFDHLVVANYAIDVVAYFLVALGLEINEPRQVHIRNLLHANIRQFQAQVVTFQLILSLTSHPVSLGLKHLIQLDLPEIFPHVVVLLLVEAHHHHHVVDIRVLAVDHDLQALLLQLVQVMIRNLWKFSQSYQFLDSYLIRHNVFFLLLLFVVKKFLIFGLF